MQATVSAQTANDVTDTQMDFRRILRAGRRHIRLMTFIVLLFVAIALLITIATVPTYSSTASVMIDKARQTSVVAGRAAQADDGNPETSAVDTQVEIIRSPAIARDVINRLNLSADPEFNQKPEKLSIAKLVETAKARLLPGSVQSAPGTDSKEALVQQVLSHLKVTRVGSTFLVNVSFSSRTPQNAARVSNAFVKAYLDSQRSAKSNVTKEGGEWMAQRLEQMRSQVQQADTALQNFKIDNNLLSAQGATLAEQEISTLDQQLAMARAQEAEAAARLSTAKAQLSSGSTGDDVGEALSSPVIQQLRQQRAVVSQRVADLLGRYGDRHPDLLKSKRELADLDAQIQAEIHRVVSNLQAQAEVAHQRTASISASVGRSHGGLAQSNRSMVRLNELQRNADSVRTLYEGLLSRYKENNVESGLEQSDAHLVSTAQPSLLPTSPKKALNLIFGLLLGVSAAIAAAIIAEVLDSSVSDVDTIESGLNTTYLGSIPSLESTAQPGDALSNKPLEYIIKKPVSIFAESFRSLNAATSFARGGPNPQVIAVTSSLPGEGKTTTAIGLARTAGLSGQEVIVVDCDLRQRSIDRMLKSAPTVGLVEVLNGTATLDEAVLLDEQTGAYILPLAHSLYSPKDLFSTVAMAELISELRKRYKLIILDTAPVILVTDTRMVGRHADAIVLLVRWRKTSKRLVKTALRLLSSSGTTVAGIALTQVDLRKSASVDPGDPSNYYLSYRKYYAA